MSATKWVISDLHFGHENIQKYAGEFRGGGDDWLISQINSVTKKGDILYILGDVAFTMEGLEKVKLLNPGHKILIRGNHDKFQTSKYLQYFREVHGLYKFKGTFWMSHAPIHPGSLRNMINIHGHVHQNTLLTAYGWSDPRYINACVEANYGIPLNLSELFDKYKTEIYNAKNRRNIRYP